MWCVCFFCFVLFLLFKFVVVVWTGIHSLVGEFETRQKVNCSLVGITVAESTSPPFCCCRLFDILRFCLFRPCSHWLSLFVPPNKTKRAVNCVTWRRGACGPEVKTSYDYICTLCEICTPEKITVFLAIAKHRVQGTRHVDFFSLSFESAHFLLSLFLLIKRQEQLHKPYVYHGMTASKPLASARQPLHAWTTHTINQINHHYNSIL